MEINLSNYPNLADKAYDIIKGDILSGRSAPGTRLRVGDLAQRLGVSRTPIKEALSRVAIEGFIRGVPRKGYFVSKRDSHDLTELLDARLMLELVAAERGIHLVKAEEIAQMQSLLASIDGNVDAQGGYRDYEQFVEKDFQFHLLTVGTAKNRHLVDVYRYLFLHLQTARMQLAIAPGRHRALETRREHRSILRAFESRNVAVLRKALTLHVHASMKSFLAAHAQFQLQSDAGEARKLS